MTVAARSEPDSGGAAAGLEDELRSCKVLVVEDTEASRRLIGAFLAAAGIRQVAFACDGVEGLEMAETFDPDLIILDIMMPRMDGFEVCRRLRADAKYRRLPILVQTALGSPEERTSVFRAGATDLVTKPIHGPELVARVRVHLENRLLMRSHELYRQRVEHELEMARDMQAALMPGPAHIHDVAEKHDLILHAHFEPSSELGGDYWGVKDIGGGRVAVFTVDFAGHGVTAAMNTFRLHTLMRQITPDSAPPGAYMSAINDRLAELLAIDQYCTFLFGVLDTNTDTFTYAAAAAPNPVHGTAVGASMIDSSGVPVGIARGIPYEERVVPFPPGTFLLLYSDALTETQNGEGLCLSDEDVCALAVEAASRPDALSHILGRFRTGRPVVGDDLTLVWLARRT